MSAPTVKRSFERLFTRGALVPSRDARPNCEMAWWVGKGALLYSAPRNRPVPWRPRRPQTVPARGRAAHHLALGLHPSNVTGGKTFGTNLGRCSAAGGGSPGARTVLRVFQMPRTGSGGQVGAGGSRAAGWQGSHSAVGASGWCRVQSHDESPDGFIPISMTEGHGCPSLGGGVSAVERVFTGRRGVVWRRRTADARAVSGGPLRLQEAQPPGMGNCNC
jgi:hypothetical protein